MPDTSKTAFLFPGQGAQVVGMGADAYEASAAARAVFEEADAVLGNDLSSIIMHGPADLLVRTENAQPAIFCVSIALLRAMEERLGVEAMPQASFMAGHSLGEYSALMAAGALDFATGLRLVQKRGELMQVAADTTPSSLIALLGIELEVALAVCEETGAQVSNVNNPGQVVIGGPLGPLERAKELALERGARRAMSLDVNGAFHTEVMRPAQSGMDKVLHAVDFQQPSVPVVGNTSGLPITTANEIRDELATQLCTCVWWQRSMEYMTSQGVTRFIEIGPGNVLSGIAKRVSQDTQSVSVGDLDAIMNLRVS
jgi:[acyl-carrier-protein] S-malonyltransferase